MRFFVRIITKSVTPVVVNADTKQEAIEAVLRQEGCAGERHYLDMEILSANEILDDMDD
jgi:hypothetical protein